MPWTQLLEDDVINSEKTADMLFELRQANRLREEVMEVNHLSLPILHTSNSTLSWVLSLYIVNLRSRITDFVEGIDQGFFIDDYKFVKPNFEPWDDIDDFLNDIGYPNGWVDHDVKLLQGLPPTNQLEQFLIHRRDVWKQFQDCFDNLRYYFIQRQVESSTYYGSYSSTTDTILEIYETARDAAGDPNSDHSFLMTDVIFLGYSRSSNSDTGANSFTVTPSTVNFTLELNDQIGSVKEVRYAYRLRKIQMIQSELPVIEMEDSLNNHHILNWDDPNGENEDLSFRMDEIIQNPNISTGITNNLNIQRITPVSHPSNIPLGTSPTSSPFTSHGYARFDLLKYGDSSRQRIFNLYIDILGT